MVELEFNKSPLADLAPNAGHFAASIRDSILQHVTESVMHLIGGYQRIVSAMALIAQTMENDLSQHLAKKYIVSEIGKSGIKVDLMKLIGQDNMKGFYDDALKLLFLIKQVN